MAHWASLLTADHQHTIIPPCIIIIIITTTILLNIIIVERRLQKLRIAAQIIIIEAKDFPFRLDGRLYYCWGCGSWDFSFHFLCNSFRYSQQHRKTSSSSCTQSCDLLPRWVLVADAASQCGVCLKKVTWTVVVVEEERQPSRVVCSYNLGVPVYLFVFASKQDVVHITRREETADWKLLTFHFHWYFTWSYILCCSTVIAVTFCDSNIICAIIWNSIAVVVLCNQSKLSKWM